MDSAEFHAAVYAVVRQIPHGRATSYGHIARLVGMPRHARHVGQALKFLAPSTSVPWHRVVSASGRISPRGPGTGGAGRQRAALEAEGVDVRVIRDAGEGVEGAYAVRWAEVGWFPAVGSVDVGAGGDGAEEGDEGVEEAEAEAAGGGGAGAGGGGDDATAPAQA